MRLFPLKKRSINENRTTWGSEAAVIRLTSQITTEHHTATIGMAVIPKTILKSNLVKEETTPTDEGVVTTLGRVVRPAAPRKSFSS